ncbi:MAG TPA: 4-hydroxy-tetrahydrodipicolinate reductase [Terriglobales bacterium]|jgi:4-hydroxy-tetrahydrodipicolinate reductase|nr:4-hydroxy-tetrahydrodipicolinate reductase [Terriglobales bacterium]
MNLLLLGKGKTGSLVAEVARERGHQVHALASSDNPGGAALTRENLHAVDVVLDFTTPKAVVENIAACARAGTNLVVGTTGWYGELPRVRELIKKSGIGFLYASNFSIGVNVFFDIAQAAAAALQQGYSGAIEERHHAQKKDKPSGTAAVLQRILKEKSGKELEITSVREGDIVGTHIVTLRSAADTLTLAHEAQSRRGFAEGAVRAAEWLAGKKGFFDFKDVWRRM